MIKPLRVLRDRFRREDVPGDTGTRWLFEDKTYRAGVSVPGDVPEDIVVARDISSVLPPSVPLSPEDKDKAVSLIADAFDVPEDILRAGTGQTAGSVLVSPEDRDMTDVPGDTESVRPSWLYDGDSVRAAEDTMSSDMYHYSPEPGPVSPPREDKRPVSPRTADDELSSRRQLPDLIRDIRARVGDDPDAIKDGVLMTPGFEDMRSTPQKRNTLNTAVRRALRKTA